MRFRDAERLAEPPRTGAEEALAGHAAPHVHTVQTVCWRQRAQQHGFRDARLPADEVETPVDAVGAVDVRTSR